MHFRHGHSSVVTKTVTVDSHRGGTGEGKQQGRDCVGAVAGCQKEAGNKAGSGDYGAEQAIHDVSGQ